MPLIMRPSFKRVRGEASRQQPAADGAVPDIGVDASEPKSPSVESKTGAAASYDELPPATDLAVTDQPNESSSVVAPRPAGGSASPRDGAIAHLNVVPESDGPLANGASTPPQPAGLTAAPSGPSSGLTAAAASASADLRQRLHRTLIREIDQSALSSMPADEARSFVEQAVQQLIDREVPDGRAGFRDRLLQQLVDDVLGLGPLEPLLRDQSISEIMVNGAQQVYVERSGKLHLADVQFQNDAHVVHVIERIIAETGRTIDESSPLVDARLEDGSRVNAVIPPASISGPLLTIRKFVADRLSADDLVSMGSLSSSARDILAASVHAGLNIIVSGGTGSGKTTMLNILSSWIPSDERIVTIEDPAELSLRQPHIVRLEARPGGRGGNQNAVTQRELLRNSLRMRPDRIIVGEVRGEEAFDMLQAMNTGHDGSLSTVHANTPRDAIRRIENMVMMAGFDLPIRAIREQIASAINLVVQVERMRDGSRRTVAISEVVGMEDQTVTMQDLFLFEHHGQDAEERIIGELKPTGLRPSFADRIESQGVRIPVPGKEEEVEWAA